MTTAAMATTETVDAPTITRNLLSARGASETLGWDCAQRLANRPAIDEIKRAEPPPRHSPNLGPEGIGPL